MFYLYLLAAPSQRQGREVRSTLLFLILFSHNAFSSQNESNTKNYCSITTTRHRYAYIITTLNHAISHHHINIEMPLILIHRITNKNKKNRIIFYKGPLRTIEHLPLFPKPFSNFFKIWITEVSTSQISSMSKFCLTSKKYFYIEKDFWRQFDVNQVNLKSISM